MERFGRVPSRLFWFLLVFLVSKLGCQVAAFAGYHWFEHHYSDTWFFSHLRRMGFERVLAYTTHQLADDDKKLKVAVLDIARLQRVDTQNQVAKDILPERSYTPRVKLRALLEQLMAGGATAVGVDIDFTPDETAPPFGQAPLLEWASRQKTEHPEPAKQKPKLYFAVGRGLDQPNPVVWLGDPAYNHMAATPLLFSHKKFNPPLFGIVPSSTTIYPKNEHGVKESQRFALAPPIPSLSKALFDIAKPGHLKDKESQLRLFFATPGEHAPLQLAEGGKMTFKTYYVNYGLMPRLTHDGNRIGLEVDKRLPVELHTIEPEELLTPDGKVAPEVASKIRDAVVLVGALHPDFTVDQIVIPGNASPQPGVLIHIAGLLTQAYSPLWELKPIFELLLGIAIIFGGGALFECLLHRLHLDKARIDLLEMAGVSLTIILVAILLAVVFNVLWMAWPAAVLGCWVETYIKLYRFPSHAPESRPHLP